MTNEQLIVLLTMYEKSLDQALFELRGELMELLPESMIKENPPVPGMPEKYTPILSGVVRVRDNMLSSIEDLRTQKSG